MQRIRHIATSRDGPLAVVAQFEKKVAVWNLKKGVKISEFDTVLDYGGTRLAISNDGKSVVAGAYHRFGIACYEPKTGQIRWQRPDLKQVQHIEFSMGGEYVLCGFEDRPLHVLTTESGETSAIIRGVRKTWESSYDDGIHLFDRSTSTELRSGIKKTIKRIPSESFAVLDAAFTPGRIAISECGRPIRCFSIEKGAELWRVDNEVGSHALYVDFNRMGTRYYFIQFWYNERDKYKLGVIRAADGEVLSLRSIPPSPVYGFINNGSHFLTWDGSIIDSESLKKIRTLDFPDVNVPET